MITILVMTFAKMSAHDHDAVSPFFQSVKDEIRVDHASTHDTDSFHVGRILKSGYAGKISAGIGAPIAKETDYGWFKIV